MGAELVKPSGEVWLIVGEVRSDTLQNEQQRQREVGHYLTLPLRCLISDQNRKKKA